MGHTAYRKYRIVDYLRLERSGMAERAGGLGSVGHMHTHTHSEARADTSVTTVIVNDLLTQLGDGVTVSHWLLPQQGSDCRQTH